MHPLALIGALIRVIRRLLRPARSAAKVGIGAARDLTRTRSELLAENALLRQQVILLRRSIRRPRVHHDDRLLLLIPARLCRRWWDALHVVNPETLLRWHRDLFKFLCRRRSRPKGQPMRLAPEVVTLIQAMAKDNVSWGAKRIRGELMKLGIRVSKRTIQKYMRRVRPSGSGGQTWRAFIGNHSGDIWACDFLQLYDVRFRPICERFLGSVRRECLDHVVILSERQLRRVLKE